MTNLEMIEKALSDAVAPYRNSLVGEAMEYSLSAGGKRIRPMLTLAFCEMLGGVKEKALHFACAVEMIHTYSLIHDDLPCMDDDDLRRGRPSCHKKFGEATALLAGDGLLTLAFNMIAKADLQNNAKVKALGILSEKAGILGMIGGQELDIKNENNPLVTAEDLLEIYKGKTSALLEAACMLGVVATGNYNDLELKPAKEYGYNLGVAFQIIDDILDVTSTEEELGKPIGSDEDNNKVTFVSIYGVKEANEFATAYSENALDILKNYKNNEFLMDLTNKLLNRKN